MIIGARLLIPDKSPTFDVLESYSGNIWKPHVWKRSKLLASSFFTIPLLVYLMQFSMGTLFGLYLWYCIVAYKIIQVIIEFALVKLFDDQLLMGPISITCDLMGGIFTFGANDFLAFLKSTFIDLCVLMIDRAYYGSFMNYATERMEYYYDYAKDYLIKHFFRSTASSDPHHDSSDRNPSGTPEGSPRSPVSNNEGDENDSDDSSEISNDPVFIENSSMEEKEEPEGKSSDDQQISFDESIEEEEEEEKPKKEESFPFGPADDSKSQQDEEKKEEEKKEEEEKKQPQDETTSEEEEEAEPPLDMYNAFARNNVSMMLNVRKFVRER